MLPHVDGLEICRVVRGNDATAGIPIIMLTARAEESDRIVGLEIGADDGIPKLQVQPGTSLVARVRRAALAAHSVARRQAPTMAHGPIVTVADAGQHTVSADGRTVTLTAKEFLPAGISSAGIA